MYKPSKTTPKPGIYMQLKSPTQLQNLMKQRGVSQRKLAQAAGWTAHSFVGRLLSGQVDTLSTDAALRIAYYLEVPVDDLFVTQVSIDSGQNDRQHATV